MKNQNPNRINVDDDDDTTLLDQVSPDLPFAKTYLQSLQPTAVNVTGTNYPGANQNLMTTGVQEGPYSNMTDYLETNTGGITKTQQFDESPYGRIGNYDEIQ